MAARKAGCGITGGVGENGDVGEPVGGSRRIGDGDDIGGKPMAGGDKRRAELEDDERPVDVGGGDGGDSGRRMDDVVVGVGCRACRDVGGGGDGRVSRGATGDARSLAMRESMEKGRLAGGGPATEAAAGWWEGDGSMTGRGRYAERCGDATRSIMASMARRHRWVGLRLPVVPVRA